MTVPWAPGPADVQHLPPDQLAAYHGKPCHFRPQDRKNKGSTAPVSPPPAPAFNPLDQCALARAGQSRLCHFAFLGEANCAGLRRTLTFNT